jgi:hypothetical protein
MSGKEKVVAARMKECSPLVVYVQCYGYLLNLALQDTMSEVDCCEMHSEIFTPCSVIMTWNAFIWCWLSVTRWSCRWEAVKGVTEQIERIVKALIKLSNDKDPKTYSDSRSLLNSICDLEFLLHRTMYTKRYLSTTSVLSTYLQGKGVDVIKRKTKRNTYLENAIPRKITKITKISLETSRSWTQKTEFDEYHG